MRCARRRRKPRYDHVAVWDGRRWNVVQRRIRTKRCNKSHAWLRCQARRDEGYLAIVHSLCARSNRCELAEPRYVPECLDGIDSHWLASEADFRAQVAERDAMIAAAGTCRERVR